MSVWLSYLPCMETAWTCSWYLNYSRKKQKATLRARMSSNLVGNRFLLRKTAVSASGSRIGRHNEFLTRVRNVSRSSLTSPHLWRISCCSASLLEHSSPKSNCGWWKIKGNLSWLNHTSQIRVARVKATSQFLRLSKVNTMKRFSEEHSYSQKVNSKTHLRLIID